MTMTQTRDRNASGAMTLHAKTATAQMKSSKKAPGISEIRYPGEGSAARRQCALQDGEVQIDCHCWEDGIEIGRRLGVTAPRVR